MKNKMIFYCKAVVNKEPGFNWLKYDLEDSDKNTSFLNQFNAGQFVEIYIKLL